MATVKSGVLTSAGEWWTHLRMTKRLFWKGERQAGKKLARREASAGGATAKEPGASSRSSLPR